MMYYVMPLPCTIQEDVHSVDPSLDRRRDERGRGPPPPVSAPIGPPVLAVARVAALTHDVTATSTNHRAMSRTYLDRPARTPKLFIRAARM